MILSNKEWKIRFKKLCNETKINFSSSFYNQLFLQRNIRLWNGVIIIVDSLNIEVHDVGCGNGSKNTSCEEIWKHTNLFRN